MTRGGRICLFSSLRNSRLAACLLRRRWTRTSSTTPAWSTARQSQCFTPVILSTTSSRSLSKLRGREPGYGHAASLIVALSARNGLCVAGSSPFRKHIAIVGSTNHLCSSKSCKFEQIMGRAHQHPFLFDLVQPAQQELPEPACLLDLPKHRLDRLLAQPIRAVIA